MAAECSPSAPPCDDAYGGKCPEGEHRHCLQYCIELGGLGDECNADPCALEPGQTVCRTGFVCVGGKCEASNAPPLMACKPAAGLGNEDSCSSGTYCRPVGDFAASLNCPGWYDPRRPRWLAGTQPNADGFCAPPARDGERCDGDWGEQAGGGLNPDDPEYRFPCRVCEPGLACEKAPWDETGGLRVCRRPCQNDAECPCGANVSAGYKGCLEDEFCDVCFATGQECDPSGPSCCDVGTVCQDKVVLQEKQDGGYEEVNLGPMCCRDLDETCEGDGQCCLGTRCVGNRCARCAAMPGSSPGVAGCCPPLVLRAPLSGNPYCGMPCPLADAGETAMVNGPCGPEAHPFVCDPLMGDVPPTPQFVTIGASCPMATFASAFCRAPIAGKWQCKAGVAECIATNNGNDYCDAPGPNCGAGIVLECPPFGTVTCTAHNNCAPGFFCAEHRTEPMMPGRPTVLVGRHCAPCNDGGDYPACWPAGATTPGGCRNWGAMPLLSCPNW